MQRSSRVFLHSYLAVALAFFFPLAIAAVSYASPTPAQQVASLKQDLTNLTQSYSAYVGHFQQYAPARMSELDTLAQSLTTFSSTVAIADSALTASSTADQQLATATDALAGLPSLISASQQALVNAQTTYDATSASLQALTPSYSQALQERNDAYTAYQSTVVNSNILEDFNGGQITSGIRFTLNGFDNPLLLNSGNPQLQNGRIFVNQYGQDLYIRPPLNSEPTTLGFETYARNGDQTITVTFTDNTTATFINPNGVGNPNCPDYYCTLSYTAPAGKFIQSYVIPGDWDILYLDKFRFSSNSYDPTAYQTYQDTQAALDILTPTYNTASAAFTSATQALSAANTLYDTYSNPSYQTALESTKASAEATAQSASATLLTAINDATVAKQATVDALADITLPPTSLEVTSTADSTESGTLRWAIIQANNTQGGIYDLITIKTTEPIILSANLPLITQNVTITGLETSQQIIDGNSLYTAFDVRGASLTLNLGNLTIQNTYASDWQRGSALWVVRGTANVTNVHFKNISQGTAVTTKEGGSYINISNSLFTNNNQGVFSNHGGTPSTTTASDTQYDNRITINTTTFSNNSVAIYGERTVLVDNSTFNSNTYAFRMQGINKHRVTNSTFDGNVYAIYSSSWIPSNWTTFFSDPPQGRVIHNNVFRNNIQKVIILDDRTNDGKHNQRGASIQGNSWDGKGNIFVDYNHFDLVNNVNNYYQILSVDDIATHPFAFSGNIDIAPRIDIPTNVQAVVNNDGSVTVTWDAPTVSNTTIERYTIAWSNTTFTVNGWGWNHDQTSVTIPADIFESTTGLGVDVQFRVRADNNSAQVYSQYSQTVEVELPAPTPPPVTVSPEPTPTPTPPAPVEPTPTVTPEPTPSPEPTPTPEPTPEPTPSPTETVQPSPTPTPTPTPEPTVTPTPAPTPSVEPTPEPTPTIPQPSTTPTPSETPSPTPTEEPTKEPTPTEEPVVVEIAEPITAENIEALVEELATIAPQDLTTEQQTLIVEAALEVFASAEQGSPEYQAALDALLVVAQADDIVIDEELAAVPVVGAAVVALADAFNALGNAGADMSPQVREQSEKVVIAAVIVGQVAMTATAAATSAAASAARTK